MKATLIILFLHCWVLAGAQFAQVGASWTYDDHIANGYQHFPRGIVSVADTVIQGQVCHLVIGDCACGTEQTNYIYEINRRAYWYNNALNDFTLLYDFNLDAGSRWTVIAQNTTTDSLLLQVDSTGLVNINGVFCKVQYVHTVATYGTAYIFDGPIIEWIGSTFCLYPQSAACDFPTVGLRCYQDGLLGLYDTHLAPACEEVYVDSGIGIHEFENGLGATLFPNPFSIEALLTVNVAIAGNSTMEIADATGRVVRCIPATNNKIKIEKGNLEAGIYFYRLQIRDEKIIGKFMIN